METFLTELRRRNVFRVAGVYAVVGWLVIQLGIALETSLNLPVWFDTFFTTLVLIGFFPALVMAWAFEMTPDGVRRTESVSEDESIAHITGRRMDWAIFAGLILVAVLILFTSGRKSQPEMSSPLTDVVKVKEGAETDLDIEPVQALSDRRSIAVLAFEDITRDRDQDYFARGISEELLNSLSAIPGLRVASRTSAFAFSNRDPKPTIGEIAEALDVAHVLEGSIRKSGQTLRITAQLIDTGTDGQIWSDTYDRPLDAENLFQLQDEIADAIVGELKARLDISGIGDMSLQRPKSLEAYEIYLRARELQSKRLPDTLAAAELDFKRVIETDPDFAAAHSGLADTYLLMAEYGGLNAAESFALARPEIEAALDLAPQSAEALTSAAMLALRENKTNLALDMAKAAIKANPNYALAYHRLGMAENARGDYRAGLAAFEQARARDPLSSSILGNIANLHLLLDEPDKALEVIDDIIRWNPDAAIGYGLKARIALENGDIVTAHELFKIAQTRNAQAANIKVGLIDIYTRVGLSEEVAKIDDSAFNQARAALIAEDDSKAQNYVEAITSDYARARIYYSLRDFEAASPLFLDYLDTFSDGQLQLSSDSAISTLNIIDSLNRSKHDEIRAFELHEEIQNLFSGVNPRDFTTLYPLLGGAAAAVLREDLSESYQWLDRIIDLGLATEAFSDPVFDPIRDDSQFQSRMERMNTLRTDLADKIILKLD